MPVLYDVDRLVSVDVRVGDSLSRVCVVNVSRSNLGVEVLYEMEPM